MFNPEMMEAAQKMMANMKPEDMQRMSQMAANMDPKVMESMMKNMGGSMPSGMDPKAAAEQMKNMTPEQLRQGMSQAQGQMSAQKQYMCNASEMLKKEGNDLIAQNKFAEALAKYEKGLDNLKQVAGGDKTLKIGLLNNKALCHIKMKEPEKAVEASEEALKVDPQSFKAFYRRGQAKSEMKQLAEALVDVRRASELSPSDKAIQTELQRLRDECKAKGIAEPPPDQDRHEVKSTWSNGATPSTSSASVPGSSSSSSRSATPSADADRLAQAAEQLAENPDMLRQATEAMSKMSPETMEAMLQSSALPPGMNSDMMRSQMEQLQKNPEMLKMATDALKSMPEEERKKLLAARAGGAGGPMPGMPGDPAMMSQVFEDPTMLQQMAEKAKDLSDDDLKRMNLNGQEDLDVMRQAAEQMAKNPEMAKQMSDMMKNMPPEQLQAMMEASAAMRGGKGPGAGAPGEMPAGMDPTAMFNDPEMIKATEKMMANMSPETFASMAKASGMEISEDKAKVIARLMPWIMRLMRMFSYVKKGWSKIWSPKGRMVLAVVVVLVAVLQHYRSSS
mmetsp:Transcript_64838/g.154800  ORF Transcript_64838/g.154800 Transcript_64838/m.154800 type:complete len:562 (-) Transcript_64838:100-1785(-)